jgi:hypothetical protein
MTLEAKLVFMKVFSFLCHMPISWQAFSHSCLPLLGFLIQVIIFWITTCASWTN